MTELPPRNKWTFLLLQLNALLDSGEHLDIAETRGHIQDGTVFGWLRDAFPVPKLDLSPNVPKATNGDGPGSVQDVPIYPFDEMTEVLQRFAGNVDTGVKNNGIALLIAYGLEAIRHDE